MIRLSVIIPTFNRRHVLERTLPTILAQDLPPEDYELIVVVDGSTDGTAEFLDGLKPKCAFRVLEAPHRGAGAARNVGVRAAVGELVLLLDDDCRIVPDLFRHHCDAHAGRRGIIVNGPVIVTPDSSQTMMRYIVECAHRDRVSQLHPDVEVRFPEGIPSSIPAISFLANCSMDRDLFLRSGGFDELVPAAEDLELGLRLWKMGVPFRYEPKAIAYEYFVKSSRQYLKKQARELGVGDLRISRKHPEYRPYARLAHLAKTSFSKKWVREAFVRSPISLAPLLALPLRMEEWFYRIGLMRHAGLRLFRAAEAVTIMRSSMNSAGSWAALKSEFDRKLPVLMYHHVGPYRPGTYRPITISPEQFERQVQWLARRGYAGITSSDWLRWLREGKGLPEKPILLTFDDAYADVAQFALPILKRYGFNAAVFVVTGRLGGTNTWDEGQGRGSLTLMTAEQIRFWAGQGVEFGSHGRTHADLTKLSAAEAEAEVVGSKSDLSELLGSPAISFAYPYGERNESVEKLIRSHFDLAFGKEPGLNYLQDDPHAMRRAYVSAEDSLLEFAFSVRWGGLQRFRDWRARFGVRSRVKSAVKSLLHSCGNMTAGR